MEAILLFLAPILAPFAGPAGSAATSSLLMEFSSNNIENPAALRQIMIDNGLGHLTHLIRG